ncbi:hypothetical protein WJ66_03167 [Stenotrophomonas maltophilia WJ66]|nr:hypothetical protein WJ66_03167 [Stenotrophomonas maltophilia WJ66]
MVVFNCLPVTASVLEVLSVASATPVTLRLALALLRTSSEVPLFFSPKRTLLVDEVWPIRPVTVVTWASALLASALAASAAVCALVTLPLVVLSWRPFTASVLVVVSAPSDTPLTLRVASTALRMLTSEPVLLLAMRTMPPAESCLIMPSTRSFMACSCLPVTASVLEAVMRASATFTMRRRTEALPTDTVLASVATERTPRATVPCAEADAA